ncbi:uncharacterized protein LOC117574247 isoform X1 [Drosophila albomicans]|uniref:Uncharacterized protein LOC117574247 isoform X1 n=1 Tax=Drosophila albomicans TaxID=7291 RepID=A0A9C6W7S2_DROAB|nr:uncharacterized protein LOC117574247 isoform X1 [Drosophila albomicans]
MMKKILVMIKVEVDDADAGQEVAGVLRWRLEQRCARWCFAGRYCGSQDGAQWRSAGRYAAAKVALRALRWPLCGGKGGAKGAPLAAMRRQRLRNGRSAGRYARNGGAKGAPLATMRAKVALRTLS